MLRVVAPMIAGILIASYIHVPLWMMATATAVVYLLAWRLQKSSVANTYLISTLVLTGATLTTLNTPPPILPLGERLLLVVEVNQTPYLHGRWARTTARVGYFRLADPTTSQTPETKTGMERGAWYICREKIQLYVDTCYTIQVGEQLTVRAYLNPIDSNQRSSYSRLMRSRGMRARAYVVPTGLVARMEDPHVGLTTRAARVQQAAAARLAQLPIDSTNANLLSTLVVGERRGLDRKLRADYARVGVSHILAVSGLHMGFVLLFVNLLLGWMALLPRGHLIKNGLVIILLWGYAVTAGLSPSVIRAAAMMSAAQLAMGLSTRANSYNILLGAATLMLVVNPLYLGDISFQLSFLAVGSILFFYHRMYRINRGRAWIVRTLWRSLLVGAAAQLGTLPLVAYTFGNIPLISLLINPLVVATAFVAVCMGLLWLIAPIAPLSGVFGWSITQILNLQNNLVTWAAELPGAAITQVTFSESTLLLLYLLMAGVAIGIALNEDHPRRK